MSHKKSFLFWIALSIFGVGIFLFLSIHYLFDPRLYQESLQKTFTLHLQREVSFGKAKMNLWGGVGIALEDFRVRDRSLTFDLFRSKKLILTARLLPLLKREIKWKRIILDRPVLRLVRDKNGRLNLSDAPLNGEELKSAQQRILQTLATLFGGSLSIREGEISFWDERLEEPNPFVEIRSFYLRLSRVSFQKPFPFRLSGTLLQSHQEGRFSISGMIENIPEEMALSKGKVNAEVELRDIEVFHFWPYLKGLLPMNKIAGILHLKGRYQGDFSGPFKATAKIQFKKVTYDHPKVFSYTFTPPWLNIDLAAEYDRKNLRFSRFSIELPEIKVKGRGEIYGIGTKEMGLDAEAQSNSFDISEGRKFIPFRIITPKVSDPLFRAEGSGPVQILSVRLSGKIPEIDQCDQLQNAHTLSIEMKVNGARLKLPWEIPPLEGLKGHLLFKGGHLHVKEMTGRFLHTSIDRAEGTFLELLQIPTLEMNWEGQFDLTDLLPLSMLETFSGEFPKEFSSISSLSGKAGYRIAFKGRLKPPLRFEHHGIYQLSKVRLIHSRIPTPILIGEGRIALTHEGIQWSGAKVELESSSLLTDGSWKKKEPFEIGARGRVDLKNLFALFQSSLFPEEIRIKTKGFEGLSGTAQLSFKGRGMGADQPFSYEVEFQPREVSFLPGGATRPFLFREGVFSLSRSGTAFSKLKIQSGNSSLQLDGKIEGDHLNLSTSGSIDLKNLSALLRFPLLPDSIRTPIEGFREIGGTAEIRLQWFGKIEKGTEAIREGVIQFKGASFQHRSLPLPLSGIEGGIVFSPKQIRCDSLKARLGDSRLSLSLLSPRSSDLPPSPVAGPQDQRKGPERKLTFQFLSPQLDLDLFFPKREKDTPTSFLKLKEWLSHWSVDGKIIIDQGSYRAFHFQDLKVEMKTIDGKLFIHPFQLKSNGGDFSATGWIQPTPGGIKFEITPRLYDMEARSFLRSFFQKKEEGKILITGRLHIDQVDLKGEGEDFKRVKESLNGSLNLTLENGVIEKGNILAKIFSLLNVSQLFKGRLPDLKTNGLPYQRISANIQVKDGVASTEDLLVDSDAMKVTVIGKVDLGKNQINAKVGVHPLVTVDTLISHIPIAGYILTGKDKAFLSYIYEVKGEIDDPEIKAIPFKSMGEGLVGIIKRLLETPLRPFQKSKSTNKN